MLKRFVSFALAFALGFAPVGAIGAGSYADVGGSTNVTDIANKFGWGGAVSLNDYTVQKTGVSGIAYGQNALGSGIFEQTAITDLNKSSPGFFGTASGEIFKLGTQHASANVASPFGLAYGNLNQTNTGSLLTVAGPGSTFTRTSEELKQNLCGAVLGNGEAWLTQTGFRSTAWNTVAVSPNGWTQSMGVTELQAYQGNLLSPPIGAAYGSDSVKITTITGTNFVAVPGYTAANGSMSANLAANIPPGNVPTLAKGQVDMQYKTFVDNGPTTILQSGSVVASVQVVK